MVKRRLPFHHFAAVPVRRRADSDLSISLIKIAVRCLNFSLSHLGCTWHGSVVSRGLMGNAGSGPMYVRLRCGLVKCHLGSNNGRLVLMNFRDCFFSRDLLTLCGVSLSFIYHIVLFSWHLAMKTVSSVISKKLMSTLNKNLL